MKWIPISEYEERISGYEGDPRGTPGCGPLVIILCDGVEIEASWLGGPHYAGSGWHVRGHGFLKSEIRPTHFCELSEASE